MGNRLTSHLSSSYVYDNLNRLFEDDQYTYTYDAKVTFTSKVDKVTSAITTYQYDDENKLIQVLTPTDVVQYQYVIELKINLKKVSKCANLEAYE